MSFSYPKFASIFNRIVIEFFNLFEALTLYFIDLIKGKHYNSKSLCLVILIRKINSKPLPNLSQNHPQTSPKHFQIDFKSEKIIGKMHDDSRCVQCSRRKRPRAPQKHPKSAQEHPRLPLHEKSTNHIILHSTISPRPPSYLALRTLEGWYQPQSRLATTSRFPSSVASRLRDGKAYGMLS